MPDEWRAQTQRQKCAVSSGLSGGTRPRAELCLLGGLCALSLCCILFKTPPVNHECELVCGFIVLVFSKYFFKHVCFSAGSHARNDTVLRDLPHGPDHAGHGPARPGRGKRKPEPPGVCVCVCVCYLRARVCDPSENLSV